MERVRLIYRKYPANFWTLIATVFIDTVGTTLLSPFFALYFTRKFNVGMTQAGILLGFLSIFGLIGSMAGGTLADRYGRKKIILVGLIFSALSSIALGLVNSYFLLYPLSAVIGLFSSFAIPAQNAMLADILPEKQRNEGYGILRVAANLSWIIGPTIGGFMASRSFLLLFILDAILSSITAVIVYKFLPESHPHLSGTQQEKSTAHTLAGYKRVFKDSIYLIFLFLCILMLLVYQQENTTLSVYLRDNHQIPPSQYGYILSCCAVLVVLTQFWFSNWTKKFPPMLMMALGCFFFMIGFTMIGFVSVFWLFLVALLIVTVGEMIAFPVGQALAARFAPEDMRGRYMGIFSLTWSIPTTIGPVMAGAILDSQNPNLVWYISTIICAVAILGFYILHQKVKGQPGFASPSFPTVSIGTANNK
jgi:MFS family permease